MRDGLLIQHGFADGIVEDGEDCDPGSSQDSACCNASSKCGALDAWEPDLNGGLAFQQLANSLKALSVIQPQISAAQVLVDTPAMQPCAGHQKTRLATCQNIVPEAPDPARGMRPEKMVSIKTPWASTL